MCAWFLPSASTGVLRLCARNATVAPSPLFVSAVVWPAELLFPSRKLPPVAATAVPLVAMKSATYATTVECRGRPMRRSAMPIPPCAIQIPGAGHRESRHIRSVRPEGPARLARAAGEVTFSGFRAAYPHCIGWPDGRPALRVRPSGPLCRGHRRSARRTHVLPAGDQRGADRLGRPREGSARRAAREARRAARRGTPPTGR